MHYTKQIIESMRHGIDRKSHAGWMYTDWLEQDAKIKRLQADIKRLQAEILRLQAEIERLRRHYDSAAAYWELVEAAEAAEEHDPDPDGDRRPENDR